MTRQDGRFSTVIRKKIRKLFFKEKNKGQLVNDLLEQHYGEQHRLTSQKEGDETTQQKTD